MITYPQFTSALEVLGLSMAEVRAVRCAPDEDTGEEAKKRLQRKVKKAWKRVAFELHPDRHDGDEEKAALFKIVKVVVDELQEIRVGIERPKSRRLVL